MVPLRSFLQIICALFIVVAFGVIGYKIIGGNDWSWLDALYMTVITVSTVGYKEVYELTDAGRIFSVFLIIGGVGVMFYAVTTIAQYVVEGNFRNIIWRRRMNDKISKLKDHIIVCGYGRVGKEVTRVFKKQDVQFVVIDPHNESIGQAAFDGHLYIQGNAASDEILKEAGIEVAKGLVAAAGSDADNVFITLSARGLHPDLSITARAGDTESESKLKRAGADRAITPLALGGRRLAMLTLHPFMVDFIDTALHTSTGDLSLEEIQVSSGSPIVGKTIEESKKLSNGAIILAIRTKDNRLLTNLSDDTSTLIFDIGDEIVVIGTHEQLKVIEGSI